MGRCRRREAPGQPAGVRVTCQRKRALRWFRGDCERRPGARAAGPGVRSKVPGGKAAGVPHGPTRNRMARQGGGPGKTAPSRARDRSRGGSHRSGVGQAQKKGASCVKEARWPPEEPKSRGRAPATVTRSQSTKRKIPRTEIQNQAGTSLLHGPRISADFVFEMHTIFHAAYFALSCLLVARRRLHCPVLSCFVVFRNFAAWGAGDA